MEPTTVEFQTEIAVKPQDISNRKNIIISELKKNIGKYSRQYGYIAGIEEKTVGIGEGRISDINGSILFNVGCKIKCIKPKIDDIVECTVKYIFKTLIVLKTIDGLFETHIFENMLNKKDYFFNNGIFENKKTKSKIEIGKNFNVQIVKIEYENCKFSITSILI